MYPATIQPKRNEHGQIWAGFDACVVPAGTL